MQCYYFSDLQISKIIIKVIKRGNDGESSSNKVPGCA
jgi:hypothetical protein